MKTAALITHTYPPKGSEAAGLVVKLARERGWHLVATPMEASKHNKELVSGIDLVATPAEAEPDLCIVLGGDGSVLYGLRQFARTGVPVLGVNFGTVGFLTTVERDSAREGIIRAFSSDYETLTLSGLEATVGKTSRMAINDFAFTRQPHGRMAELHFDIAGEEVGRVRCDGMVVATPVGSTGYNLANQGPILAWGTKGYVVSYISPHSLTARPLVVGPDDILNLGNAPDRDPVDIEVDGEHVGTLSPNSALQISFVEEAATLAQLPGTSFYKRIASKFGHLAA